MESIIAKCHQGSVTSVAFKGNKIHCGSSSAKLPSYEYVHTLLKDTEAKRRKLILKYLDSVDAYVKSGKKELLHDLDPLVKNIQEYDHKIAEYKQEYYNVSSTNEDELFNEIQESLQSSKSMDSSTYDVTVAKKELEAHRRRRELFASWKQLRASWNDQVMIAADKVVVPKAVVVHSSPKVKGKLSPEEKVELKDKIKSKMLTVFKFKTLEECQSKARSKPFYQSKEEILKLITENENLKKLMPSNYKSLNKEELCKYLI